MNVRFLSVAELDLDEAVAYYEEKELGLGLRFLLEIRNSLERIVAYPEAWNLLSANNRRCRTKVFPSGLSSNFTIQTSSFTLHPSPFKLHPSDLHHVDKLLNAALAGSSFAATVVR